VELPTAHPGWFRETLPKELPQKICFAHLDGDFYDSIIESLEHDYCDPSVLERNNILPGAKKACDDFLAGKPEKMTVLIAGPEAHAYFRKM
jgi:O-methyltransferase